MSFFLEEFHKFSAEANAAVLVWQIHTPVFLCEPSPWTHLGTFLVLRTAEMSVISTLSLSDSIFHGLIKGLQRKLASARSAEDGRTLGLLKIY